MQNSATTQLFRQDKVIHEALALYDLEVDIYQVTELSPIVLRQLSNFRLQEKQETLSPNGCGKIEIPCGTVLVKSLTTLEHIDNDSYIEDLGLISPIEKALLYKTSPLYNLENKMDAYGKIIGKQQMLNQCDSDEGGVCNTCKSNPCKDGCSSANYLNKPAQGHYIKFDNRGDGYLYIPKWVKRADLRYITLLTDEHGFPLVDEYSVTAIAAYLHYTDVYKKVMRQALPAHLLEIAAQQKQMRMGQAYTGDNFTENEKDALLSAMKNLNFKVYGYPNRNVNR